MSPNNLKNYKKHQNFYTINECKIKNYLSFTYSKITIEYRYIFRYVYNKQLN